MASQYSLLHRVSRLGSVYVYDSTVTVVASTTTLHTFDLPPGAYRIGGVLQTIGNANNTVTLTFAAFADENQVEVGANMGFNVHGAAGGVSTLAGAAAAGTTNNMVHLAGSTPASNVSINTLLVLPFGLRISTVTGAGTAAGTYKVRFVAVEG